ASKAGLIGFTKSLAKELETKGISANLISPGVKFCIATYAKKTIFSCFQLGFIETGMTANLDGAQLEEIKRKIPLQRMGLADEVANVAYFLATSPKLTGQVVTVDGGLSLTF